MPLLEPRSNGIIEAVTKVENDRSQSRMTNTLILTKCESDSQPNLECGDLSPLWPAAARRRDFVRMDFLKHQLRQVAATKATTARRTPNLLMANYRIPITTLLLAAPRKLTLTNTSPERTSSSGNLMFTWVKKSNPGTFPTYSTIRGYVLCSAPSA